MSLFGLGPGEIILVLFVLLLFFGKERLPELAKNIGKSFKELKEGVASGAAEVEPSKVEQDAV